MSLTVLADRARPLLRASGGGRAPDGTEQRTGVELRLKVQWTFTSAVNAHARDGMGRTHTRSGTAQRVVRGSEWILDDPSSGEVPPA